MSDTPRQQRNAARIRDSLRRYRCFIESNGQWKPVGPLVYFANKMAGGKVMRVKI